MPLKLRQVPLGQLTDYLALQVQAFAAMYARYQDHETTPANQSLLSLIEKYQKPGKYYYFIDYQGETIGGMGLFHLTDANHGHIGPVFILPEHEGQGLGQEAMIALEKMWPMITRWDLHTIKEETKLLHFYQKLGYQLTTEESCLMPGMTSVALIKER